VHLRAWSIGGTDRQTAWWFFRGLGMPKTNSQLAVACLVQSAGNSALVRSLSISGVFPRRSSVKILQYLGTLRFAILLKQTQSRLAPHRRLRETQYGRVRGASIARGGPFQFSRISTVLALKWAFTRPERSVSAKELPTRHLPLPHLHRENPSWRSYYEPRHSRRHSAHPCNDPRGYAELCTCQV